MVGVMLPLTLPSLSRPVHVIVPIDVVIDIDIPVHIDVHVAMAPVATAPCIAPPGGP